MGCHHSKTSKFSDGQKKKKKIAKNESQLLKTNSACDGSGDKKCNNVDTELEKYEQQLKVLQVFLASSETVERDQILRDHPCGDLCELVNNIIEKVRNETAAELTELHEEQIKSFSEQQHKETEEMKCLHTEETNALKEAHTATESALKDQIEQLVADLKQFTQLKQRVKESTLKRDLQRNIQTHGSPGEFWEQEQESLLIVIEMKSERLQEQGSKLQQMEDLVERNLVLQEQVQQVLRQNEDLRARMDNYQSLINQLSKDQNELQETLEKQSLLSQKLSQEKEELLFKLLHRRDSCSAFHIQAGVPAEISSS